MGKILVIGSSNTDMVIKSNRFPQPGETVIGSSFLMNQGGKGANQAVAAVRLGGDIMLVAKVGNDIFGHEASDQFKKENIDIGYLSVDAISPSGIALINVNDSGENCISVAPGANDNLLPADIKDALDAVKKNDVVLLQLEIPIETVEYAILEGFKNGARVILNPAPVKKISEAVLSKLYMITPNKREAELLTGVRIVDVVTAQKAAAKLYLLGIQNVIITLGSKGAYILNSEISEFIGANKVKAIDTTAAGDCFNGALAVALSENNSITDAMSFACHAASISVTRIGAQSSLPYRNEIYSVLSSSVN